jgi:hypothetical protein
MELSSLRGMNTVENVSSELRWVGAVLGAEHQPQVAARYIHMSAIYFSPLLSIHNSSRPTK